MDPVARGLVMYLLVLVIFRLGGRRTLAQVTTFDLVLLLIIAETTQQALIGPDYSITNAGLLILTLMLIDIGLSLIKRRFPGFDRLLEGIPLVIVEDGLLHPDLMRRARVGEDDILTAARDRLGFRARQPRQPQWGYGNGPQSNDRTGGSPG